MLSWRWACYTHAISYTLKIFHFKLRTAGWYTYRAGAMIPCWARSSDILRNGCMVTDGLWLLFRPRKSGAVSEYDQTGHQIHWVISRVPVYKHTSFKSWRLLKSGLTFRPVSLKRVISGKREAESTRFVTSCHPPSASTTLLTLTADWSENWLKISYFLQVNLPRPAHQLTHPLVLPRSFS